MDPEMDEDGPPDQIRSADEVARRALALFSAVGISMRADRKAVLQWLRENDLWVALSPMEAGFVDNPRPPEKQVIQASWWSERLVVLLWALGEIEHLPAPDQQCDTAVFQDILPPFADVSVSAFLKQASLRPDNDLMEMAEKTLRLHGQARDAKLNSRAPAATVDLEIIQERHHAINWVIGYDGLSWDEVTADT